MVQLSRHGKLTFKYDPNNSTVCDPEGIEHRRQTLKSWSLRGLVDTEWHQSTVTAELTVAGIDYLLYLKRLLNEVPLG